MLPRLPLALLAALLLPLAAAAAPEPATIAIDLSAPAGKVSPIHYGLMTEEINFSYDGGLYAELLRNRAFRDDPVKPVHWSVVAAAPAAASIALDPKQPLNAVIPVSLCLDATAASPAAPVGVANEGYWGIPVKPSTRYRASFRAKAAPGFTGPLTVAITSLDGATVYARGRVDRLGSDWAAYEVVLKTGRKVVPTTQARLTLTVEQPGTVWFGLVSLFPPTWKNRPNGLRPDLMQMLVDLKPGFLRFPGGNYLEGDTIDTRFKWWETIGPLDQRPGHPGPWGYRSSDGMGLMEFLLWAKDMGAEPLLGLYAGYSLKGDYVKPGPDLEPFIREALDEIEYVVGPVTSKWGALRARDGHPEPFPLRYVEIGNEDWFDKSGSYDARYAQFAAAINRAYPSLKCISSIGNEQPAAKRVHSVRPDVLDEHYYRNTETFLKDSPTHFDRYDRSGPEIFVGEWAAHETAFPPWDAKSRGLAPTPTMKAALGDAAWMSAMERHADFVTMQCYAPLFANVNGYQWRPNLIGYDALNSFGAPSYHAFRMYSTQVGDALLKPVQTGGAPLHAAATRATRDGFVFLKLVNTEADARDVEIRLAGARRIGSTARVETLSAAPDTTNSITDRTTVIPIVTKRKGVGAVFTHTLPAHSITVLRLEAK